MMCLEIKSTLYVGFIVFITVLSTGYSLRVITPEVTQAFVGSDVTLVCYYYSGGGRATTHVTLWQKINDKISETVFNTQTKTASGIFSSRIVYLVNDTSIRIENISTSDTSLYRCQVTSLPSFDQGEATTFLDVLYPPKITQVNKVQRYFKPGETILLECLAKGNPPNVTYNWLWNGVAVNTHKSTIGSSFGKKDLTVDDGGTYTCSSSNVAGEDSFKWEIIMYKPAKIDRNLTKSIYQVNAGADVTVLIFASGLPENISYVWSFTPYSDKSEQKFKMNDENVLNLHNITWDMSGEFQVSVANGIGNIDKINISLYVEYPLEFTHESESSYFTTPGVNLTLPCMAKGIPPIKYHWSTPTWNNITEHFATYIDQYLLNDNGSLVVLNVSSNQVGPYTCYASNDDDMINMTTNVAIYMPPTLIEMPLNTYHAREDSDVVIKCVAIGYPSPVINWFRENELLPRSNLSHENTNSRISYTSKSLTIAQITSGYEGKYRCEASNKYGLVFANTKILVEGEPRLVAELEKNLIHGNVGGDVSMSCGARGRPLPSIEWHHSSHGVVTKLTIESVNVSLHELITDDTQVISNLKIESLAHNQLGMYVCKASNKFGEVYHTTELKKLDVPTKPCQLEITSSASKSIWLQWSRSDEQMQNLVYYARWEKFPQSNRNNSAAPPSATLCTALTTCTVANLSPNTLYKIFVYGENEIGKSEESVIFVRTKGSPQQSIKNKFQPEIEHKIYDRIDPDIIRNITINQPTGLWTWSSDENANSEICLYLEVQRLNKSTWQRGTPCINHKMGFSTIKNPTNITRYKIFACPDIKNCQRPVEIKIFKVKSREKGSWLNRYSLILKAVAVVACLLLVVVISQLSHPTRKRKKESKLFHVTSSSFTIRTNANYATTDGVTSTDDEYLPTPAPRRIRRPMRSRRSSVVTPL